MRIPPVKAVMTPFPHSVDAAEPPGRADELLREHGIHHLPVTDGDELVGVVSARELRAAGRAAGEAGSADAGLRVGDLTSNRACIVELDEPLDNVLLRMAHQHCDCALVVRGGKLVGIFTVGDACLGFAEHLREHHPAPGDDAA